MMVLERRVVVGDIWWYCRVVGVVVCKLVVSDK